MSDQSYGWTRYWIPRGIPITLHNGYLPLPSLPWASELNPELVELQNLQDIPCLILLGEPGTGKSFALQDDYIKTRNYCSQIQAESFLINLAAYTMEERLYSAIFDHDAFMRWKVGNHRLYIFLDSLDEGLLQLNTLARLLSDSLAQYSDQNTRLFLRLACRTAEWPSIFEARLKNIWEVEQTKVYEIAPLSMENVAIAAHNEDLDWEDFLIQVNEANAQPFAIKPVTLNLLINLVKAEKGIPKSQILLYHQGCLQLCTNSPARQEVGRNRRLTPEQTLQIAATIAALTRFGNRSALWTSTDETNIPIEAISLNVLEGKRVANVTLTGDVIRETLDTGLFRSLGSNQMGWSHQTYAEFLAAYYLDINKVSLDKIMRLITHSEDNHVVPQLYETSAWLAGMRSDVLQKVMDLDPELLVRSDIGTGDNESKFRLVSKLLELFARKELLDRGLFGNYLKKLNHPRLTEQLKPYLYDKEKNFYVRDFAIDFIQYCNLQEMCEPLVEIALDTNEVIDLRIAAAATVYRIGETHHKQQLKPLAFAGNDPNQDLKGITLLALYPDFITPDEVFSSLLQPPSEDYIGFYSSFLSPERLVEPIKSSDLQIALRWVANRPLDFKEDYRLEEVVKAIMLKAWNNLDNAETFFAFIGAAENRLANFNPIIDISRNSLSTRNATHISFLEEFYKSVNSRRRVAFGLVTQTEVDVFRLIFGQFGLLNADDIQWMIAQLEKEPNSVIQQRWIDLITHLAPSDFSAVYEASKKHKLLAQGVAEWFGLNSIDPVQSATEKYQKKLSQLQASNSKNSNEIIPYPMEELTNLLIQFENGELSAWWLLNLQMLYDIERHPYTEATSDLLKLPGWIKGSEETRRRILEAAKCYVLRGTCSPQEWLNQEDLVWRPAYAGYRALCLIYHEDPDFLSTIDPRVWKEWAPIITRYNLYHPDSNDPKHPELLRLAAVYADNEITKAFMALVMLSQESVRLSLILPHFEGVTIPLLNAAITDYLVENWKKLSGGNFWELLKFVLERNYDPAVHFAQSIVSGREEGQDLQEKIIHAAHLLMNYHSRKSWDVIWNTIQEKDGWGQLFIEVVADDFRRDYHNIAEHLLEEDVADLFIWTETHYPHHEDPDIIGVHAVGTRENVAQLRNNLLRNLQSRGTTHAVDEVRRIKEKFPEWDYLKHVYYETRQKTRQDTWMPSELEQILSLIVKEKTQRGWERVAMQVIVIFVAIVITLLSILGMVLAITGDISLALVVIFTFWIGILTAISVVMPLPQFIKVPFKK
jgi:hypothetical protein